MKIIPGRSLGVCVCLCMCFYGSVSGWLHIYIPDLDSFLLLNPSVVYFMPNINQVLCVICVRVSFIRLCVTVTPQTFLPKATLVAEPHQDWVSSRCLRQCHFQARTKHWTKTEHYMCARCIRKKDCSLSIRLTRKAVLSWCLYCGVCLCVSAGDFVKRCQVSDDNVKDFPNAQ